MDGMDGHRNFELDLSFVLSKQAHIERGARQKKAGEIGGRHAKAETLLQQLGQRTGALSRHIPTWDAIRKCASLFPPDSRCMGYHICNLLLWLSALDLVLTRTHAVHVQ